MISKLTIAAVVLTTVIMVSPAYAEKETSLSVPLSVSTEIQRQDVSYVCKAKKGASSAKMRGVLAEKVVKVSYVNAGDISLAVLQIEGKTQIFSNVIAADGAKYVAGQYVWWTRSDEALFSSETDASAMLNCHEIKG